MTTMIALVGEQPLPNFLPLLHDKPDVVILVYTTTTQSTYENLKGVLEKQRFPVYGIKTDPYDTTTITATLKAQLEKLPDEVVAQPLVFNLTGGTKTMVLAAYQLAAKQATPVMYIKSEGGKSIIERYSWQDHQLYLWEEEPIPEYLRLDDMLELHLGPSKDVTGKTIWAAKGPTKTKEHSHLFEIAIAQALSNEGYEAKEGVKGENDQLDIDVLIGYHNQIGMIEAKTSENGIVGKLDGLKQLSMDMGYIRGTYVKQFLVIAGTPSPDLRMMSEILRVQLVPLHHYKRGPEATSLSDNDRKTLLEAINKFMSVA